MTVPSLSEDAADTRIQTETTTELPRYAIRMVDAETIEVDWLLSPEIEGKATGDVNSDQFTFCGALWNLMIRRLADSEYVGVYLKRDKSVYSTIVIAFNFSLIQQNIDAPLSILDEGNAADAFKPDVLRWGYREFCTKTQFDTWLKESNALIFRAQIRLANGIFSYSFLKLTIDAKIRAKSLDALDLKYLNHATGVFCTRVQLAGPSGCSAMSSMYGCQDLADVMIVSSDSTERLCHSFVVAVSTPVFKAMLTCGMKESTTRRIKLPETSTEVIDVFLKLAYGIDTEVDNSILDDLIAFAKMYDVTVSRTALAEWLQIPTDGAPQHSNQTKSMDNEEAWFCFNDVRPLRNCCNSTLRRHDFFSKTLQTCVTRICSSWRFTNRFYSNHSTTLSK
jgi:hypothetical protein